MCCNCHRIKTSIQLGYTKLCNPNGLFEDHSKDQMKVKITTEKITKKCPGCDTDIHKLSKTCRPCYWNGYQKTMS